MSDFIESDSSLPSVAQMIEEGYEDFLGEVEGGNPPPKCLQRSSNDRHIIWTVEQAAAFEKWWNQTRAGKAANTKSIGHPRWTSTTRTSKFWACFDQVADARTGTALLCCKLCSTFIKHPNTKRSGNTAMSNHVDSSRCRVAPKRRGTQSTLDAMFASVAVGSSLLGNGFRY